MNRDIDSYSGFFDNGRKKSTGLNGFLKERNVTSLFICGLASDYCVYYTAMDALSLGYPTTILEGSTKPIDPIKLVDLKENFKLKGGNVSTYIL